MGYQDRMREEGSTEEDILLEARRRSGNGVGMPTEEDKLVDPDPFNDDIIAMEVETKPVKKKSSKRTKKID